jgi:hypothetical protein
MDQSRPCWWVPFVAAVVLVGCVDPYGRPNYTGSGALIGGGSGALLGAAVDRRNPAAGALIGGAAGLVTGSLIGHGMDEDARRRYYPPPPVYPAPLADNPAPSRAALQPSIAEIKSMTRAGVGDEVMVNQIAGTRAVYYLTANDIIDLKNARVSDRVINAMIATSSEVVVDQGPPPPPGETIVVAPGPEYYWCPGEWSWSGVTGVWHPGRWILPPHRGAVWIEARWEHGDRGWRRMPGRWR